MKLSKRDALLVYVLIKDTLQRDSSDEAEGLLDLQAALHTYLTDESVPQEEEDDSEFEEEEEEEEIDSSEEEEEEADADISALLLEELPPIKVKTEDGVSTTLEFESTGSDLDSVAAILGAGHIIDDVSLLSLEDNKLKLHVEGQVGWHVFELVGRLTKKWKVLQEGSVYEIRAEDE